MSCVAAIQHTLRDIDSRSCKVRLVVNVLDSIDRTTMNAHPHLNVRMSLQGFADLERTAHWFFRTAEKKERHPVSSLHSNKFTVCFRRSATFRCAHDLIQVKLETGWRSFRSEEHTSE